MPVKSVLKEIREFHRNRRKVFASNMPVGLFCIVSDETVFYIQAILRPW